MKFTPILIFWCSHPLLHMLIPLLLFSCSPPLLFSLILSFFISPMTATSLVSTKSNSELPLLLSSQSSKYLLNAHNYIDYMHRAGGGHFVSLRQSLSNHWLLKFLIVLLIIHVHTFLSNTNICLSISHWGVQISKTNPILDVEIEASKRTKNIKYVNSAVLRTPEMTHRKLLLGTIHPHDSRIPGHSQNTLQLSIHPPGDSPQ